MNANVPALFFWVAGVRGGRGRSGRRQWDIVVQAHQVPTGCAVCGSVAVVKDRRPVTLRDLPLAGRPVVVTWFKRGCGAVRTGSTAHTARTVLERPSSGAPR